MKVIGYNAAGNADTLEIIEMDQPVVGPRDLLVAVEGISVNPVDVKLRAGVAVSYTHLTLPTTPYV